MNKLTECGLPGGVVLRAHDDNGKLVVTLAKRREDGSESAEVQLVADVDLSRNREIADDAAKRIIDDARAEADKILSDARNQAAEIVRATESRAANG